MASTFAGSPFHLLPRTSTVGAGAAPTGTIEAVIVATGRAVVLVGPAFALLYALDQRSLLPEDGVSEPG